MFGLPLHPLVVHLTVVAVPLAALPVVLVAVIPRLPWLVRWSALVLSALSLALIPVTENSGEALEHQGCCSLGLHAFGEFDDFRRGGRRER